MNSNRKSPARKRALFFCGALLLAGVLIGIAWRIPGAGLLGVVGLGVFFASQAAIERYWQASLAAVATGTIAYLIACSWFTHTIGYLIDVNEFWSTVLTLPVCMIQAGHYWLFAIAWLFARKVSKVGFWLAPPIWVATQGFWPGLFPCRNGCLLLDCPELCQVAELGGVQLVSLVGAMISLTIPIIANTVSRRSESDSVWQNRLCIRYIVAMTIATVCLFCWGKLRSDQLERVCRMALGKKLRVLMVQADTEFSHSNKRMIEVSRQFAGAVDLVVWPECALGNYNQNLTDFRDPKTVARNSIDRFMGFPPFPDPVAPLLAGGSTWTSIESTESTETTEQPKSHFVSAMLFDASEQLVGRHDKVELMPYGESIPGEAILPFLRTWFGGERVISQGHEIRPVGTIAEMTIGVALCCEDMHPELSRSLASQGADLLVTLGNGMAFNSEVALVQHFRIAHLRAIENRRYVLRCTSHGVSGLISPNGKVSMQLPMMQDAAGAMEIPTVKLPRTVYSNFGFLVDPLLIGLTGVFLLASGMRERSTRSRNHEPKS